MRVSYKVFAIVAVFFFVVGAIYGWFQWNDEPVGIVALLLTGGLATMISFYLWLTSRRIPEGPEDNPAGEIYEAEGVYGFFAPHSWWPLALGASCGLLFLGVAIGWWLVIISVPFLAITTVGWTFEYFRGDNVV